MEEVKGSIDNTSITKTYQTRFLIGLIIYFIIVIVAFIVLSLIFPDFWLIWIVILIVVVIISVLLLVYWHKQNFAYRCKFCEYEFRISFLVDLLSPHGLNSGGGWKYLKCPKCYKRSKATVIRISTNTQT